MKEALLVFTPYQVGALRMAIAALTFAPLTVFIFKKIPKDKWQYVAVSGLVGNLSPAFLFPLAQTSLSSSVTGILNALTPLFTLLVSIVFFGNLLKKRQIAGLLLGFAGACSLSLLKNDGSIGKIDYHVLYIVLATFCYGISINVVRQYLGGIKAIYVAACALTITVPFSFTYLLFSDFVYRVQTIPTAPTALLYLCILGVLGSALALILFNKLVQISSAIQASLTTYIIPIVALFWGWQAGEVLTIWHFLGMLLIISGVYVVNKQF
jgi:drug/metabolite transporter (DMT)-like permease